MRAMDGTVPSSNWSRYCHEGSASRAAGQPGVGDVFCIDSVLLTLILSAPDKLCKSLLPKGSTARMKWGSEREVDGPLPAAGPGAGCKGVAGAAMLIC